MRRTLSTFLILLYCVGPLAAVLPASSESHLPACCRRHGAHHCGMSTDAMSAASRQASLRSASHCPLFPDGTAVANCPLDAATGTPIGLPALLAQPHSPAGSQAAARQSQIRTRTGRGPPDVTLL